MAAKKKKEHVIVVGIDFGTTFSGVSWAYSGQPDVIEVITRWETELNFASDTEKTPTAILFQKPQAIWPDYAKARMRNAAEHAGITQHRPAGKTSLTFISEPEAAALATTKDVTCKPQAKKGDYFVVCDAGGGTVDLISYEITSLNPTVVREAIKGDGGLCGGVFLDEAFLNLIKEKVTPAAWAMVPNEEAANMLNCDWENGIKQRYEGQENRTWNVRLPPECQIRNGFTRGIKRKRNLMLGHNDLHHVFDPIAKKIGKLIQKQIDGVLTVSGKLPKSSGTKPLSLSPDLAVSVRSRISRASYGIEYRQKFDPRLHDPSDKYWYQEEQDWYVNGNMKWFLEQGMDVSSTQPVRHEYYRLYSSAPKEITDTFHVTAISPAPKRQTSDVKRLCDVTWNKMIDFEALPRFTNSLGKVFGKLEFIIEMACAGASIDFTVIHDGKRVCSKNVEVDFEGNLTNEDEESSSEDESE
ncbi:hypothetical protein CH35J_003145 [Colletotrichum higginsianum]|uniref:Hsp70 family chaperone n=1 Tax=Colletotrichum higginsianum TaxID=80884 RepID=A0A4T0WFR3_9PEZI|nr:hypothetical protein CH35J_003145 [Colletotrichum higginsianum]